MMVGELQGAVPDYGDAVVAGMQWGCAVAEVFDGCAVFVEGYGDQFTWCGGGDLHCSGAAFHGFLVELDVGAVGYFTDFVVGLGGKGYPKSEGDVPAIPEVAAAAV